MAVKISPLWWNFDKSGHTGDCARASFTLFNNIQRVRRRYLNYLFQNNFTFELVQSGKGRLLLLLLQRDWRRSQKIWESDERDERSQKKKRKKCSHFHEMQKWQISSLQKRFPASRPFLRNMMLHFFSKRRSNLGISTGSHRRARAIKGASNTRVNWALITKRVVIRLWNSNNVECLLHWTIAAVSKRIKQEVSGTK